MLFQAFKKQVNMVAFTDSMMHTDVDWKRNRFRFLCVFSKCDDWGEIFCLDLKMKGRKIQSTVDLKRKKCLRVHLISLKTP